MHRQALVAVALSSVLAGQVQHEVVPAAYASQDAVSYLWVPGASSDVREVTLVGSSHLGNLLGREITALEYRRTAANEVYGGGVADLTVSLSHSPRTPLTCSNVYADNVGADATTVFQGSVTIPTSPVAVGPAVAWSPQNVIRIALQQPFRYMGGTLCIDVVGTPVQGQIAGWWMADAMFEDVDGAAVDLGQGCGTYVNARGQWSFVATRTLLPGAYARLWAYGSPGGLAVAVFGAPAAVPVPLQMLGIPAPGCVALIDPAAVLDAQVLVFVPEPDPRLASRGGMAELRIRLPNQPWTLGTSLTTQWLDLLQPATSNAIRWTVAMAIPTLDMALVDGHPSAAGGEVSVHLAHVLRFEHRP